MNALERHLTAVQSTKEMYTMKLKLPAFGIALAAAVLPAAGQTPVTPSTCNAVPTSIQTFNVERTLALDTAGVFTTMTPTIPPALLAAVQAGAVEVRERAALNTGTNTLTFQAFTVAPGSPIPTPPGDIQFSSVVWGYSVLVQNTYFSCQPVPSVLMVGKVINNYPVTPFGSVNGALVAVTLGYTTDNPSSINNFTVVLPGIASLYSPAAMGTLTFPNTPVTPPGGNDSAPVIVFTPAAEQSTAQKQLVLDASKSTDPHNLQLSFAWTQVNAAAPAGLSNANTATPIVTFSVKGDYVFEVTVTNSNGDKSTARTTIHYYGQ
jgi:hypothetical protein